STGTTPGVHGIGLVTGEAINHWDMGTADGSGVLNPTNSIINDVAGHGFNPSATNQVANGAPGTNYPKFKAPYNITVSVSPWRVNPRFRPTAIVGVSLPANAIGDYHLLDATSPAVNAGAASKSGVNAPGNDIDNDGRAAPVDEGADEVRPPSSDMTVTKTHTPASVAPGGVVTYTIDATNLGPDAVVGATVTDGFPAKLSNVSWTCTIFAVGTGAGTNSCPAPSGLGNITSLPVSLRNGATARFVATATVAPAALPGANAGLPAIQSLDTFTRASANTLGANWSQIVLLSASAIRTNGSTQAVCALPLPCLVGGLAYWNGTTGLGPTYGAKQGAAYTFINTPANNSSLVLKAGNGNTPTSFIRVRYETSPAAAISNIASVAVPAGWADPVPVTNNSATDNLTLTGNRVSVYTTANLLSSLGSVPTTSFAAGTVFSAVANADGSVDIWKTNGGTTYLGRVAGVPASFTTGRVGMELPNAGGTGATVDDFKGGTVL
ncbi:MAG: DUF11 domain-containing protein, partial [Ilumatobacteraceae bacterium]|nr:DUF11 domain-containing protein [Ilumatobacteraceae bacterium]